MGKKLMKSLLSAFLVFSVSLAMANPSKLFPELNWPLCDAVKAEADLKAWLDQHPYPNSDDFIPWPGISGVWAYTDLGLYAVIVHTEANPEKPESKARVKVTLKNLCTREAIARGLLNLETEHYEKNEFRLELSPENREEQRRLGYPFKTLIMVVKAVAPEKDEEQEGNAAEEVEEKIALSIGLAPAKDTPELPLENFEFINVLKKTE